MKALTTMANGHPQRMKRQRHGCSMLALCRSLAWSGCLLVLSAQAGEIVILQPAPQSSRSEQQADRAVDKARQKAGRPGAGTTTLIVTDDPALATPAAPRSRSAENAERSMQDADDYLRPSTSGGTVTKDGTTVILRSAPSDAGQARQKARSYLQSDEDAPQTRKCVVVNEVGMIGGVKSDHVVEKGSSAVMMQCR